MSFGGIDYGHICSYQIKCMMANQYKEFVSAIENYSNKNNVDEIIVTCLRLGWNDAFRHVSENTTFFKSQNDTKKAQMIINVCISIVDDFKKYMLLTTTQARVQYIDGLFQNNNSSFRNKFSSVKVINPLQSDKALCFGHIQKMFNMAVKLLFCLVHSAEHASSLVSQNINVKLGKDPNGNDILLTSNNWWNDKDFDVFRDPNFSGDCPIDSFILKEI